MLSCGVPVTLHVIDTALMSLPSYAVSLSDPAGAGTLVAAVAWLQGTLLGTFATTVAVVAVASVGLGMLAGRLEIRRGVAVIVGCFLVFGASSIVAGVRAAIGDGESGVPLDAGAAFVPAPGPSPTVRPPPTPYDPYAGASVPSG